jgi:uncharacterized protein
VSNVAPLKIIPAALALLVVLACGPSTAQEAAPTAPVESVPVEEFAPTEEGAPEEASPLASGETVVPGPSGEIRIVVFGDSLAHNLGGGLVEVLEDAPDVVVSTEARGSSGLVRDDFFDWAAAVEEFFTGDDVPDIGVVMIGLNDRQALRVNGQSASPLSDPWREAYAARIDAVVVAFEERRTPLIWVGLPPMESSRLSADLAAINEIARQRTRTGGAIFVDIWQGFVDGDDRYTPRGPDLSGQNARLRASDGIHFTPAGASKAAHFADIEIRRLIERPSERVEIARAAIEAADDPRERDEAIDLLIQRSLGDLPPLPGFEEMQARPVIGPLLPLTRLDLAPGGVLLSGRPGLDPATRLINERALEEGVAPSPVPGRADDFSWPRQ